MQWPFDLHRRLRAGRRHAGFDGHGTEWQRCSRFQDVASIHLSALPAIHVKFLFCRAA
jgi:hypothetical protein